MRNCVGADEGKKSRRQSGGVAPHCGQHFALILSSMILGVLTTSYAAEAQHKITTTSYYDEGRSIIIIIITSTSIITTIIITAITIIYTNFIILFTNFQAYIAT